MSHRGEGAIASVWSLAPVWREGVGEREWERGSGGGRGRNGRKVGRKEQGSEEGKSKGVRKERAGE